MKKMANIVMLVMGLVLVYLIAGADEPMSWNVGQTNICISPDRRENSALASAWVANTAYSQGDLVLGGSNRVIDVQGVVSSGLVYMCSNLGDLKSGTNRPTHVAGIASDGMNSWLAIPTGWNQRPVSRRGIEVMLLDTNGIYISIGRPAVASKGIPLPLIYSTWSPDELTDKPVYVISGTTNALISVQEW